MEYTCPCGKVHKSRNTVHRHKKALAEKDVLKDVPKGQKGTSPEDKKDVPKDRTEDKKGQSVLKEINLLEEYNRMTETVNPKKDEKKEPKYKCGACSETFDEKYKRCPHCGVEF